MNPNAIFQIYRLGALTESGDRVSGRVAYDKWIHERVRQLLTVGFHEVTVTCAQGTATSAIADLQLLTSADNC